LLFSHDLFPSVFLPELVLLAGTLGLFVITLGESRGKQAANAALAVAFATLLACVFSQGQQASLFNGAYRIDAFSQC